MLQLLIVLCLNFLTKQTINFTKTRQSTETVSGWVVMIRKSHHSWQEMRNGKQENETATLGCYDTSVELYIIQDNRVYMLCKVDQVFSARGGRPIHA